MANEQGRYSGETIQGIIGEDVGLGQVVYSRTISTTNPDVQNRGVWYPASADEENEIWIMPGLMPKYVGSNQLGVVVQAASYSAITLTQSGTETTIMLKGYYSPGYMGYPGYTSSYPDGYYYSGPGAACGAPLYLLPKQLELTGNIKDTRGGFSNYLPSYSGLANHGLTQGVARIIGYAYSIEYPYVVKFDPDNTWIEF